ncbi:MAG: shikimate dehydrogenase [Rhodospirillales bacterium]|nr:shikimate dehydrogenase [Rhodospirillales bacterium]
MPILSGRARVAGLLGWPVAHSRSPRLHGFWLERYGIDGAYVPLPVPPGALTTAVRGLLAAGFAGCNVTIPHKEAAYALCDSLAGSARRIEAVNTLVFRNGKIHGSSTDGAAFLANLRDHGVDPAAGPALVLGAGGASRDILAALIDTGIRVSVTNRTPDRPEALRRIFPSLAILPWEARAAALADHALLVNTTAAGMAGEAALEIDLARAPASLTVADIVYVPLLTPLLAAAGNRGLCTVPGLGMLLHQAVPGFAAWFGVEPSADRALFEFVAADLAADLAAGTPPALHRP